MNGRKKIAVVAGGDSSEIVVSQKSAEGILSFLDASLYEAYLVLLEDKNWRVVLPEGPQSIDKNDFSCWNGEKKILFDCAYITIHGTPGEDGKLQAYFELIGMPYTSCGVLASALSFNKYVCNQYLLGHGIPVADAIQLFKGDEVSSELLVERLSLPCFVKPNLGGSSFGISKVREKAFIQEAIAKAFEESDEVIVESFLAGRELTCGVYCTAGKVCVLPVTEVITPNDFFDYEAKYVAGKAKEITPAPIGRVLTDKVQSLSERIYKLLNCRGVIRIDYIVDDAGKVFVLEVNTTPGMTKTSFIPQQIAAAGLSISDVFSAIIEDAMTS